MAATGAAAGSRAGADSNSAGSDAVVAALDEAARLLLTDPDEYPIDRLVADADWLLSRLEP